MLIPTFIQAGTKILMADNTYKAIELIKVDDYVSSLEMRKKVHQIIKNEVTELIFVTGNEGSRIGVTPDQTFNCPSGGIKAKDLQVDDIVMCFTPEKELHPQYITEIVRIPYLNKKVYNFNLHGDHIFSANGFVCRDYISQQIG